MATAPLGFGMMRLPVLGCDPTAFDYAQINDMVDEFIGAGFSYFDTSYVYHKGRSEEATRKAVVERHARDSFTVATKFPTFILSPDDEDKVEPIFASQLEHLGVDHVDYYLLHNIQTVNYDGIDGMGGPAQTCHLFEHAQEWVKQGKVRHLGISMHSSTKLLNRILTEHPEVEFVQLAVNYMDWESRLVQARACCEVVAKHGRKLVVMEPVKGGGLATAPEAAEPLIAGMGEGSTPVSVALRFAAALPNTIACLSGMSTIEQVRQNIQTFRGLQPLTDEQVRTLLEQVVPLYKGRGPVGADLARYEGTKVYGVDLAAILEAYNTCQFQPDPGFSDDNNYLKNAVAEEAHLDLFAKNLPRDPVTLVDGTDATELAYQAIDWLRSHSF